LESFRRRLEGHRKFKPGGGLIVVHNRFAVVMFVDAVGRNPFTNNLTSKSQKPNVTSGQRWAS